MRDTSLLSFNNQQSKFMSRAETVLQAIRELSDSTALELTHYLGQGDNSNYVRPRITELVHQGKVVSSGTRVCLISMQKAHVWKVKP